SVLISGWSHDRSSSAHSHTCLASASSAQRTKAGLRLVTAKLLEIVTPLDGGWGYHRAENIGVKSVTLVEEIFFSLGTADPCVGRHLCVRLAAAWRRIPQWSATLRSLPPDFSRRPNSRCLIANSYQRVRSIPWTIPPVLLANARPLTGSSETVRHGGTHARPP